MKKFRSRINPSIIPELKGVTENVGLIMRCFELLAEAFGKLVETTAQKADPKGKKMVFRYFNVEKIPINPRYFELSCNRDGGSIEGDFLEKEVIYFLDDDPEISRKQKTALKKLFVQMGFKVGRWKGQAVNWYK